MEDTAEYPVPGRRARADGGFAMLSVILLILVFAAVSVLMLGAVVRQVKPTMFEAKSTRTISAAESGIDATLSQFRTATVVDSITGDVYGDPHKLPCVAGALAGADGGVVAGTVGVSPATLRYDVTIRYFNVSPADKSEAWRASSALPCVAGTGLANPPNFALITSVGSDVAVAGYAASVGNRKLESVYTFQVSNSAINGGVIYSAGDAYCLQASSRAVGATITYVLAVVCRVDDASRLWSYGKDYKIHLSVTDLAGSTPLCITGRGNINVTLQVCDAGPSVAEQTKRMFSWEGGARWRGQTAANDNYSSECLGTGISSLATVLTDKPLMITGCGANDQQPGSFDPDPRVGPGAADYSKHQVVSFLEFGRCFDVTDETVLSPTMIIYPCKQDPSPGGTHLLWNHKWYYTEPTSLLGSLSGPIKVVNGGSSGVSGVDYCLTTPAAWPTGSPPPPPAASYPTLSVCSSGSLDQSWTRTAKADTYAKSWLFTDRYGRCIGLGDKLSVAKPWTQMIVAVCNGGPEQKWNAPATAQSASLDNFKEVNH